MNIHRIKREIASLQSVIEGQWWLDSWYQVREFLLKKITELRDKQHIEKLRSVKPGELVLIVDSRFLNHIGQKAILVKHLEKKIIVQLEGRLYRYEFRQLDVPSEKSENTAATNRYLKSRLAR